MGDQWGPWDGPDDDELNDVGYQIPVDPDVIPDDGDSDEHSESPLFEVSNPHHSVTVAATIDGGVRRVDLAPSVVKMTEYELADEIRAIAGLATMKAGSVVHAFLVEGLRTSGHDTALIGSTLSRGLGLLSPEQVAETTRDVFAERYGYGGE